MARFSPPVLVLPNLPGTGWGEWSGGCCSSAPRSRSPLPRPALSATVSDRRGAGGARPAQATGPRAGFPARPALSPGTNPEEPPLGRRKLLPRLKNKDIRSVGLGQECFKPSGSLLKFVVWLWGFTSLCCKAALPTFPDQHTNYLNNVSSQRQLDETCFQKSNGC